MKHTAMNLFSHQLVSSLPSPAEKKSGMCLRTCYTPLPPPALLLFPHTHKPYSLPFLARSLNLDHKQEKLTIPALDDDASACLCREVHHPTAPGHMLHSIHVIEG